MANPVLLADVAVFDAWIGNDDRNPGNVVFAPREDRRIWLYAIDFEKSLVLRGDRFGVGGMRGDRFRPRAELAALAKKHRTEMVQTIQDLGEDAIHGSLAQLVLNLDGHSVPWFDTTVDVLIKRAEQLPRLMQEMWNVQ